MDDCEMDALKISPRYDSEQWSALSKDNPQDWSRAVEILRDRLEGRFLRFVDNCISDPFSGFIVLAVDSLLAETLQQFRMGATSGKGKSQRYIETFLAGYRFQPDFDEGARTHFYEDIRCGLLHQAEATEMWLVRRKQPHLLQPAPAGRGYILDVERFHDAVRASLDDYCTELTAPAKNHLRINLWRKMDQICRVRAARGLTYEASH